MGVSVRLRRGGEIALQGVVVEGPALAPRRLDPADEMLLQMNMYVVFFIMILNSLLGDNLCTYTFHLD